VEKTLKNTVFTKKNRFYLAVSQIRIYICARKPKNTYKKMKNLFTVLALATAVTFVACGPSAEELEAAKKKTQDSIDSVNAAMQAEEAAKEQARMDSIKAVEEAKAKAMADSLHEDSVKRKLIKTK
jgi:hypothetical protein